MTKYQDFLKRKQFDSLAELCYENNLNPEELVSQAIAYSESNEDENLYSELMQGVGQFVGNMAGAAKAGMGNFANGVQQGYGQVKAGQQVMQNQMPNATTATSQPNAAKPQANPAQNPARAQSIKQLSTHLQQLTQMIPQMSQQLQMLQQG